MAQASETYVYGVTASDAAVLKAKGIGDDVIKKIMVDNPRRALTFVAPQPAVAAATR